MPFSASMGGAFLFGEGVHGWANRSNGRYMDDLWLYDANGHRWVALYPGTDIDNPPELRINDAGFEALPDGTPVPIATMVHGYEMTTWDPVRQLFFAMPNHHVYHKKALPSVAAFREANASRLNVGRASPWIFDPWNRNWHRLRTVTPSPNSGYGAVLEFVPSVGQLFYRYQRWVGFYDPSDNRWREFTPSGPPPPFGIDPVSCVDPKRNRVYMGGGNYPVAKGPNALWYYDVGRNAWVDPKPAGSSGGNHFGTNVAMLMCDTVADRVLLFRHGGERRGVYIYDPVKNAWSESPLPLPASWRIRRFANGFFHPGLGVHFAHLAGDSEDDGIVLVYRPPR